MTVLAFFEWLDASPLAAVAKAYGGIYAAAQSLHLASLALLGGTVLVTDLRLMNIVMRDVPSEMVAEQAHKWFKVALCAIMASGAFMVAGVAQKVYYNEAYWAKMAALLIGILFVFFLKRPLLQRDHSTITPWVLKTVAVASTLVWFTVAACGRWIGFS